MTVNTKKAVRRELSLGSVGELLTELDRIQAAYDAGTLRSTGNWTAAQVLEHCARSWDAPIDGFPAGFRPPRLFVWFAKLFLKRGAVTGKTPPAGIKLPKVAEEALVPGPDADFDEAMAHMRRAIGRTEAGERFTHPSPLFRELTHEQWLGLQLGHCQLHLGFLDLG